MVPDVGVTIAHRCLLLCVPEPVHSNPHRCAQAIERGGVAVPEGVEAHVLRVRNSNLREQRLQRPGRDVAIIQGGDRCALKREQAFPLTNEHREMF